MITIDYNVTFKSFSFFSRSISKRYYFSYFFAFFVFKKECFCLECQRLQSENKLLSQFSVFLVSFSLLAIGFSDCSFLLINKATYYWLRRFIQFDICFKYLVNQVPRLNVICTKILF